MTTQDEMPGAMKLAQAVQEQQWPHTMDAQVWAKKWAETIATNPGIHTDEGAMLGWFANAIMAGYDTARQRSAAEKHFPALEAALRRIAAWDFDFRGDCVADATHLAKSVLAPIDAERSAT